MLETYAPLDKVMEYYGSKERPGGHFPFNFLLISDLNNDSSAYDFDAAIHKWMDNMPEGRWANWVVSDSVDRLDDLQFGRKVRNFVGYRCLHLWVEE
jgi:alpha-glucosidase